MTPIGLPRLINAQAHTSEPCTTRKEYPDRMAAAAPARSSPANLVVSKPAPPITNHERLTSLRPAALVCPRCGSGVSQDTVLSHVSTAWPSGIGDSPELIVGRGLRGSPCKGTTGGADAHEPDQLLSPAAPAHNWERFRLPSLVEGRHSPLACQLDPLYRDDALRPGNARRPARGGGRMKPPGPGFPGLGQDSCCPAICCAPVRPRSASAISSQVGEEG